MVSSAQRGTFVSSANGEAFRRGPLTEAASSRCSPEPPDTGNGATERCFLHELQDELIQLLAAFLGTPTQGSVLLSVTSRRLREAVVDERFWRQVFASRFTGKLRMPSLWRYSCGEDLPLRPALLLLSSLSCRSHYTSDEASLPAAVLDEALLSPQFREKRCGPTGISSARRKLSTAQALAAFEKPVSCDQCLSVSPSASSTQSLLQSSATTVLTGTRPTRLGVNGTAEKTFDSVLSVALKKAGVPSGGQCWRGKYFFKHALERKFARGQFDLQHTWFLDNSPLCSPRFPDEISGGHSPQQGFRVGRNNIVTCHFFQGLTKNWTNRKYLHQHHPGHLCPYRYPLFLVRRAHRHGPSIVRKVTRNIGSSGTDNFVTEGAAVPAVCVVGMKFFGDGAGLVYAARAGGVGACCPDLGYKLRSFAIHTADGDKHRQRQGEKKVHAVGATVHARFKEEIAVPHSATRRDIYQASLLDEIVTPQEAGRGDEARLARELSDEGLVSSDYGPSSQRHCPLAVCVTHTIDEALCSGGRDPPLVLAGFSDGKVCIWDYRRPRKLLRCLDIAPTGARGSVAIKSLCMVKGGPAFGAEVLAGADDGRVSLLNLERPDAGIIQRLRGHTAAIQAISVHPEKGLGFTASRDRYVHLYDLRASEMPVASCGRHRDWAMCVQMREGLGANTFDSKWSVCGVKSDTSVSTLALHN